MHTPAALQCTATGKRQDLTPSPSDPVALSRLAVAQRYRLRYRSRVNSKTKLLDAITSRPKQVRFKEACKAAELLGFVHHGGKGSHRAFAKAGEPTGLNFQNRDGFVPPYQARQLIEMIRKYAGATE